MPQRLVGFTLLVAGIIHLLPIVGVLGGARLEALYGVRVDEPALALLLRHRAVLFGILGAFLVLAAWRPAWHVPALAAACVSVASFLVLARLEPEHGPALARVVLVDALVLALLAVAALAMVLGRGRTTTATP
jgi:hypothetical protein